MAQRKRMHMRARRAILLTLRMSEETMTANQLVARMIDLQCDGVLARNFGMPTPRAIGNMMKGWKGIRNEYVYPHGARSKILSYELEDLDAAEGWLRGDA